MYFGEKKIESVVKVDKGVLVEFEKINDTKPKPLRTTQELVDYCSTEELEEKAETKLQEKRVTFLVKVILQELIKKGSFVKDSIEQIKEQDAEKLHKGTMMFTQRICDELLHHNIYMREQTFVTSQVVAWITASARRITDQIDESFKYMSETAYKKLFDEGEYDTRTLEDIHKLNPRKKEKKKNTS